jgi:hypothetical protein
VENVPLLDLGEGGPLLCRAPDLAKAHKVPVQTLYSAESCGRIIGIRRNGKLYLNYDSAMHFVTAYHKLTPLPEEES